MTDAPFVEPESTPDETQPTRLERTAWIAGIAGGAGTVALLILSITEKML